MISPRPSTPTGLPAASTTGNSLWLVRSSVSHRLVDRARRGVSVANWVIIAALTGTPRDIARIATSCASDAAAR